MVSNRIEQIDAALQAAVSESCARIRMQYYPEDCTPEYEQQLAEDRKKWQIDLAPFQPFGLTEEDINELNAVQLEKSILIVEEELARKPAGEYRGGAELEYIRVPLERRQNEIYDRFGDSPIDETVNKLRKEARAGFLYS